MQLSLLKKFLSIAFLLVGTLSFGQYQVNAVNTAQTINFGGFDGSGFAPSPTSGQLDSEEWEVKGFSDGDLLFGGTETSGDFARGVNSGGTGTGGVYSFDNGTGASLGFQASGSDFSPGSFTLAIQNNTGEVIEDLTVEYEIWVYNDQGRSSSFNFEHGSDNTSFTAEASLDFASTEAADGSPAWTSESRSITITGVNVNDGDNYYFKWISDDVSGGGSRDEIALDNISITGVNAGTPASPSITASTSSLTGFNQPVGIPSDAQMFTVSGADLEDDIAISVTAGDYQISLNEGGPYSGTITLTESAGEVTTTDIYVRLNGSASANPSNGELQLTSTNATTQFVSLLGVIAEPSYIVDFEDGSKGSYATGTVNLNGLDWEMSEALIGSLTGDFTNGNNSARIKTEANGYIEMLEDKSNGLGELTFEYRAYDGDNAQQPWIVEISTDGGGNWVSVGDPFTATETVQVFSELVNVAGDVRMRIVLEDAATANGERLNIDDIEMRDFIPYLEATPLSLSGFENVIGFPSTEQSFLVSGLSLTDQVELVASAGYEISLDAATDYASSLLLDVTNNELASTTIYVRLNDVTAATNVAGTVTINSQNATEVVVDLLGDVIEAPSITATPNVLTGFVQELPTPSSEQSFSLSGDFLLSDVTLTVSGEYEISLVSGGTFETSIDLTPTAGEISATDIFVRLNGAAIANPENGYVVITSQNLVSDTVFFEGLIQNPSGTPTVIVSEEELNGFVQFVGTPSDAQELEVWGTSITGNITVEVTSGDYQISLSETTGFTNSISLPETAGEVDFTTIYVRLNGTAALSPASGEITVSTTGATDILVPLNGDIYPEPLLGASETDLTGFSQTIGAPSLSQSFVLAGQDLIEDVLVTVTAPYEISFFENSGYTDELTVNTDGSGNVGSTTIFVRLNGSVEQAGVTGTVTISSAGTEDWLVNLEGDIMLPVPTITRQPIALSSFVQILGEPSPALSFDVSGEDLDGDITIEVTSGDYEISLLEDQDFATSLVLEESAGEVTETTIYVRLNGAAVAEDVAGLLTLSSLNAEDKTVSLLGDIVTTEIILSTNLLVDFEQEILEVSAEQSFTVEVLYLLEGEELTLTVDNGYEISLTSGADFTDEIILTETDGSIEETTIFVRLNGDVVEDPVIGTVTVEAGQASDEVQLEGETFVLCTDLDLSVTQDEEILTADMSGVDYQWIDCFDNSPIAGATNQTFIPEESGSYAVEITDDWCSGTSDCFVVDYTNVDELEASATVKLYPNPIQDAITIEFETAASNEVNVEMLDAKGAVILSKNNVLSGDQIETSALEPGVYVVIISGGDLQKAIKVVK